jgi:hypothetical protein
MVVHGITPIGVITGWPGGTSLIPVAAVTTSTVSTATVYVTRTPILAALGRRL